MKFTFAPESRPLEGFTIKRAIYRGGFGEVYYALSDAGREVALKLLQNNAEVELRGIQQCLNLSHPNLVTIFDVRQDGEGDHWIIMEYVSGETLDQVIRKHSDGPPRAVGSERPLQGADEDGAAGPCEPREGMPLETVRKWLPGIVAGVAYLHSRGIVHRDLKPANIFSEDGVVKIGDVGLSKFITPSRRSAQTQSVGTVYYMAPEVAKGKYGREVDVYALGVILYEMLTGQVPFDGESTGEILMKHLSEPPDLGKLPPRLRGVIGKALHKDPEKRFRSMDQLRRAFEDALLGRVEPIEIPEESFVVDAAPPLEETQRYESVSESSRVRTPQPESQSFFARNSTLLWGVLGGLLITLLIARGRPGWAELILGAGAGCAVAAVLAGRREFSRWGRDRHHGFERVSRSQPAPDPRDVYLPLLEVTSQAWGWLIALILVSASVLFVAGAGIAVVMAAVLSVLVVMGLSAAWDSYARSVTRDAPRSKPIPVHHRHRMRARPPVSHLFGGTFLSVPLTGLLTTGLVVVKPSLFTTLEAGKQLDPAAIGVFSAVAVAACWGILTTPYVAGLFGKPWTDSRISFAATGVLVGLLAFLADQYLLLTIPITGRPETNGMFQHIGELPLMGSAGPTWAGYATFFGALFAVRSWSGMIDPRRRARFSVAAVLWTIFLAWLVTTVFSFPTTWAVAWGAVIGSVVQLASPWDPTRTGTKAWR